MGGFVEFVMKDGTTRDMAVTGVGKNGKINGTLFFDGTNDRTNFPQNVFVNLDHQPVAWVKDVEKDDSPKPKPGTYHEISETTAVAKEK
jgi:hypothetical protein